MLQSSSRWLPLPTSVTDGEAAVKAGWGASVMRRQAISCGSSSGSCSWSADVQSLQPEDQEAWQQERFRQEVRLAARQSHSASSGADFLDFMGREWRELERSVVPSPTQVLGAEQSRLEQQFAFQCKQRDLAQQRAQVGVLDGRALQIRAEAARQASTLDSRQACQAAFAIVQQRQVAADEAAKQRWQTMATLGSSATTRRCGITAYSAVGSM